MDNKPDLKSRIIEALDIPTFYKKYLDLDISNPRNSAQVLCPFHPDQKPSLSVNLKTGAFRCFACDVRGSVFDFYAKINGTSFKTALSDLAVLAGVENTESNKIVKTYDYVDLDGKLIHQTVRKEGKKFRQRRPDGNGGWIWNLDETKTVLYRLPEIIDRKTVFIVEGEKDADNLFKMGVPATCNPMGAGNWCDYYNAHFEGKAVIIISDNDDAGRKHAESVAKSLWGTARAIRVVHIPNLPDKGDISDWIEAGGTIKKLAEIVKSSKSWMPKGIPKRYTANELFMMEFPEPKWAVEGLIAEGLTILGGKPKHGKSCMALNLCLEIALGGNVFGEIEVEGGSTLYLALEDPPRRLQGRLIDMLKGRDCPKNFIIYTQWPKMMQGGLRALRREIGKIKDLRLVVIDTLKKFRPDNDVRKKNLYDIDYDDVDKIKAIAEECGVAILIIHHLRKMSAEDVMDTFSGTFGLTGAADSLLALTRKNGQSELHIVGRDIEENVYAMKFDKSTKTWDILGKADEIKRTNEQQQLYNTLRDAKDPLSPKELSEITGLKIGYIKNTLPKLMEKGNITKTSYGRYVYTGDSDDSDDSSDVNKDENTVQEYSESSEYTEDTPPGENELADLL